MKTNFYFIRHGQSQHNADGRLAGQINSPLTALGEQQATGQRSIVEALPIRPTRIVTSTLERAIRTADIINLNLRLPVTREAMLCEQHYGDWQNRERTEIYGSGVEEISFNPPGGEAIEVFTGRILRALDSILTGDPDDYPLIVGHGGMADALGRHHGFNLRGIRNGAFIHFIGLDDKLAAFDHRGAPFLDVQPRPG